MSDFLSGFNTPPSSENKSNNEDKQKTSMKAESKESRSGIAKIKTVEHSEFDPNFKKKQQKRRYFIYLGIVISLLLICILYYKANYISIPNFEKKTAVSAQNWAVKNKFELKITPEYHKKIEANQVIQQSDKAGTKRKKGSTINLKVSQGPDPDEIIQLPDFSKLSEADAGKWIQENKAENLKLIKEYSDSEEKGAFLRTEIKNKEITPSIYKRKDLASVFYSKGKETFEKNITVPKFSGKTKAEVESWAKTNEIEMSYEEADSNEYQVDQIISQNIGENEKIAKKDKMTVTVSLGKATIVPNFANLSSDSAGSISDLSVSVEKRYNLNVPYGQLISQSVAADTKLTAKDNQKVTVVYSEGRPYLKDFRGTTEGELQKQFYEEYLSKGATIKYNVKYVDSSEVKGTVVNMSTYNEYVPLDFTVEISISKGNLEGAKDMPTPKQPEEHVANPT